VNSFDHELGEIRYDTYAPTDVHPALDAAEADALARLAEVPAATEPLLAFGEACARYDFIVAAVSDMASALSGEWLVISRAADERAARFRTAVYQRRDLYDAIRTVSAAGPVEQRLRADLIRRFEHAGAHLDAPARARLSEINARLAALGADFMANLQAADAASGVATNDPAGLPDTLMVTARTAAAARGLPGWYVPYSEANAITVLRDAENRELREAMHHLTVARASESNTPVVAEYVALRQELAELLGYPNYVALHREGRMVADPQAFLDELARAYRPHADREHAELLAFARSYTGDQTLQLTAADIDVQLDGFYATKLRESLSLASAAGVRIPLEIALPVMFEALGELYGITFTSAGVAGWHPDVEAYDMRDASGRCLARIFGDWYVRDGKRPGGWMGAPWLATDGSPHLLTVVTNIPPTGADLHHLRILWHEFGHALHFGFTRSRYRLRSPDDGPPDFIEGPSRIMENWPYDAEILRRMGVDAEVAEAAKTENRFHTASRRMVRMARPAIDLALHRGEDVRPVKQRHLPVPIDPDDATAAHFFHIFTGGYGAGHYAYQWAGVLAEDLFTRFSVEGLLNPETGRDYAEKVLSPGAERDPVESIRDFLGRDVSMEAMLARDGVG
jgi:oligopeptidase A